MKTWIASMTVIFGFSVAQAEVSEACKEKSRSDLQSYYESINNGSSRPALSFEVREPTLIVDKPNRSKSSFPPHSSPNASTEEGDSDGLIRVVNATGFVSYTEPPYALLTIEYSVRGTECVEKPSSRQIRYLVSQPE